MMQSVFLSQKPWTNKSPRSELISHLTPVLGTISFPLSSLLPASRHGLIWGSSRTLEGLNLAQAKQPKESRLSSWRQWINPPTLQLRTWVIENVNYIHHNMMENTKFSTHTDPSARPWIPPPRELFHKGCWGLELAIFLSLSPWGSNLLAPFFLIRSWFSLLRFP